MHPARRSYLGALILIVLGVLFLLENFGLADVGNLIGTFWPVILILIGISILMRRHQMPVIGQSPNGDSFSSSASQSFNAPMLNNSSVFGDIDMKVVVPGFRGGMVSCVFGDVNLDLSEMQMADGEHLLKLDGVFGGLHVLLPKDLAVFVTARAVFGDVKVLGNTRGGIGQELSFTSPNYADAPKKLRVYANQVFGDVRIW
ncbi:MAG: cell wall-active antibiotics response protein LiaF [Ignavibacteriales bacterium]|nr:cell wall-active antibiotics response protein LiaF [Ignavibacteriales bacterium]